MLTDAKPSDLSGRYRNRDLSVFTPEEARRFVRGKEHDPGTDSALAWELLYRLEPRLYDRLVSAEALHPSILEWLPGHVDRVVEVGAGTGRLTVELTNRCDHLVAVEPAAPMREILASRLAHGAATAQVEAVQGFFDDLPVADDWASLVISCSALTPDAGHGGDAGLAEMERVCRSGGQVVIVWPNHLGWLKRRGFTHRRFPGQKMSMSFSSPAEAIELTEIFYPDSASEVRGRGAADVPYKVLGVNPPCDLAYKVVER